MTRLETKSLTSGEPHIDYDKEADVLYVTLGIGEPSYCEEKDDRLLIERGFVSHAITGFRILNLRDILKR